MAVHIDVKSGESGRDFSCSHPDRQRPVDPVLPLGPAIKLYLICCWPDQPANPSHVAFCLPGFLVKHLGYKLGRQEFIQKPVEDPTEMEDDSCSAQQETHQTAVCQLDAYAYQLSCLHPHLDCLQSPLILWAHEEVTFASTCFCHIGRLEGTPSLTHGHWMSQWTLQPSLIRLVKTSKSLLGPLSN